MENRGQIHRVTRRNVPLMYVVLDLGQ